ncbi:MAG: LuxR C-terminal-related transcriptional regulator [Candidatus Acidiferrum sp.]
MMNSACEAVCGNCWAGIIEPLGEMQVPFSDLIFNTTIGVALFNREFRCVALGHVLSRMMGVSAGEQLGKTIGQFLPDEACLLESSCHHVWDTGESLRNLELSVHCFSKPERRAWISSVYPVRDEFGQVKLLVAIFSDVTLRRCAERKLGQLKDKFGEPSQDNIHPLGGEFAELSARAYELSLRSLDLLGRAAALRRNTLEMRIEAGLARAALFLRGTHYQEILTGATGSQLETEEEPFHPEPLPEDKLAESSPSPRERQLLYHLADGKSNKEIASILRISQRTVEFYRARIMLKLGLHSTAALVRYAIRNHIVEA